MKKSDYDKSIIAVMAACLVTVVFSVSAAADTQTATLSPAELSLSAGQGGRMDLIYDVLAVSRRTTGLGLRIHFDSSRIESIVLDGNYGEGLIAVDAVPREDAGNNDGDPLTDKYIGIAWLGVAGDWPSFVPLPLILGQVLVKVRTDCPKGDTVINISASATPEGFTFSGKGATLQIR